MDIKECLIAAIDALATEGKNERLSVRIENASKIMVLSYAYLRKLGLTNDEILEKFAEEKK